MNTQENNEIELLENILDKFDNGFLIPENNARKCYLTEKHRAQKIITWVHDHELAGHSLLRKMGKSAGRDLLRQPNIK
jgi:proteasome lid subunit RPN8/RPN11